MNVLVIVADSLRYDHLACHGPSPAETPNLASFATESLVFENCYAEGLPTLPARTAMWQGRFTGPFRGWQSFEPADLPIAEWLWGRGYTSALVTDVYHMHKPHMNFGRGFDEVYFIRGQEYDEWIVDKSIDVADGLRRHFKPCPSAPEYLAHWRRNFEQYLRNVSGRWREEDYFLPRVVERAIQWLERQRGRDCLFLWVDCFDPHEPWDPPEELKAKYDPGYEGIDIIDPVPADVAGYLTPEELQHVQRMYAAEVEFVDRWVGRLLDAARTLGYLDNTLVLFTSDHGEPLNDHGVVRKCRPWNYEELAHVPLLIRLPGAEQAGRRIEAFVQHPDYAPTLCDFLGLDVPPGTTGTSFRPIITGECDSIRDFAVTAHLGASWTIRTDQWTYQMMLRPAPSPQGVPLEVPENPADRFGAARELFNRQTDPHEQCNVVDGYTEIADEMELKLRRFMASLKWE
ncbi:MAG: sulfatase [Armatimonadota bacterium]